MLDINLQDGDGNTPLHVAVESEQKAAIEALIQLGADTSVLNDARMAPVHLAVDLGLIEPLRVSSVHFYDLWRIFMLLLILVVIVYPFSVNFGPGQNQCYTARGDRGHASSLLCLQGQRWMRQTSGTSSISDHVTSS